MQQKLRPNLAKKGARVQLSQDLSVGKGFGNKFNIPAGRYGDIIGEGFVLGTVTISFYSHIGGTERIEFNEFQAADYLLIDVY
jgi:hypothetical protein